MFEEPEDIVININERAKRRSAVIWSGTSITGHIWDIVRNLIIVAIVVGVYSVLYDPENIIIVSILILIYLSVLFIGAGLSQAIVQTNFRTQTQITEILKRLGKEETEDDAEDFENARFLLEKIQYKFILNSVFHFIIFIIVVLNLLGTL